VRRRLVWAPPPERLPTRPYRDTVIVNAGLAALVVVVAYLTGGSLPRAIAFAAFFFVVATAWAWRVWRRRLREEEAGRQQARPGPRK
jgi:membrane protein implicated in regulation of membrane protease activity